MKKELRLSGKIVENIIVPMLLFVCSFYDFNKGIDIKDAGYSMGQFIFGEYYPGNTLIPTFWSNVLGSFFSKLPGGMTWYGLSFYCTVVVAVTIVVSYFMCKKMLDWKIVAVSEIAALFFCWNPNTVLYDYLSFFLFTMGIFLLLISLEQENKSGYYILSGIVFGINTFVRLPNIAEIVAIVLLWYYGYAKEWKIKVIVQRTILCVAGYVTAVGVSIFAIVKKYGFYELKLSIYNLFHLSQSQANYGLLYMATETFVVVLQYTGYMLGLGIMAFLLSVLIKKWNHLEKVFIVVFALLTCLYYYFIAKKFKVYNWNWQTQESVLGLACIFLLWGLVCSGISLLWSKRYNIKIYALIFIVVFFVMPLGSNNNIYLEIMNMFLLIPISIYITKELLVEWKEREKKRKKGWTSACIASIKTICCGSLLVMVVHIMGFGMFYVFNDTIEIQAEEYFHAGMYSSEKRISLLDEMYEFCAEEELLGSEAIFYCNAPGLSVILQMPTAIESTWADWYTYSIERFAVEIERLSREKKDGKEYPLVIFNTAYHRYYQGDEVNWEQYLESGVSDKLWLLNKFMRDNQYKCIYQNEEFAIYKCY